jgi:hypothetical protein
VTSLRRILPTESDRLFQHVASGRAAKTVYLVNYSFCHAAVMPTTSKFSAGVLVIKSAEEAMNQLSPHIFTYSVRHKFCMTITSSEKNYVYLNWLKQFT